MAELGYEVYEDTRSFEKTGFSGVVKRYTTESMRFPCYIVDADKTEIEEYRLKIITNMFKTSSAVDVAEDDSTVSIYVKMQDKTVRLGQINSTQVKAFLKLFETKFVVGYYDENTELLDDYLYVLAQ